MLGVSNSRPIQTHNRQTTHRLFCFNYAIISFELAQMLRLMINSSCFEVEGPP